MSDLSIRLLDVYRKPLADTADVFVSSPRTGAIVREKRSHVGTRILRVTGLDPVEPYLVRAFPMRHRAVGQFAMTKGSGTVPLELPCPVDPTRVTDVTFPPFGKLSPRARAILDASHLEHPPAEVTGQALYDSPKLDRIPKAGMLNIFAKMERTPLTKGSTVLDHVTSLYRLRGDRVFANVDTALRDLVKTAAAAGLFHPVSGSLHTPPPGFVPAGSFKTPDRYGNLQVTFFSNPQTLELKADIDIDDAAGVEHVFQVVEHTVVGADTNPYDIHEILVYFQRLDPGYRLVA